MTRSFEVGPGEAHLPPLADALAARLGDRAFRGGGARHREDLDPLDGLVRVRTSSTERSRLATRTSARPLTEGLRSTAPVRR